MVTIETKITLNIDGNTLSLTKEQAEELYNLLHQELGKIIIPAFDPNKLYPRNILFGDSNISLCADGNTAERGFL